MRALAVVLALTLAALGWQSWRLNNASHTIETQGAALKSKAQELTKKNSQLIGLSILTETNSREQMRLYAAAEQTSALLRNRQHRIEELKRENEDLRRWADTPLPADIIRLRERPALAGGAAYREWLSQSDTVPHGRSAPRSNGDLNAVLDETEAARAACADKVDTIIACQEQDSEQAAVLRSALNKAVPYVRSNPDKLHLFVDNGSLVATGASSMSWEYRYTLNVVIEDFSGDQNLLMAPVLLWLTDNQPDAINNPELREKLFTFDVDILRNDVCDISLNLQLTERVLVSTDGGVSSVEAVPEPDVPEEMWTVKHG